MKINTNRFTFYFFGGRCSNKWDFTGNILLLHFKRDKFFIIQGVLKMAHNIYIT